MTLCELKKAIDSTIGALTEDGRSCDDIAVYLQINGPGLDTVLSTDDIDIFYDIASQASGFVLSGEFMYRES